MSAESIALTRPLAAATIATQNALAQPASVLNMHRSQADRPTRAPLQVGFVEVLNLDKARATRLTGSQ